MMQKLKKGEEKKRNIRRVWENHLWKPQSAYSLHWLGVGVGRSK